MTSTGTTSFPLGSGVAYQPLNGQYPAALGNPYPFPTTPMPVENPSWLNPFGPIPESLSQKKAEKPAMAGFVLNLPVEDHCQTKEYLLGPTGSYGTVTCHLSSEGWALVGSLLKELLGSLGKPTSPGESTPPATESPTTHTYWPGVKELDGSQ